MGLLHRKSESERRWERQDRIRAEGDDLLRRMRAEEGVYDEDWMQRGDSGPLAFMHRSADDDS